MTPTLPLEPQEEAKLAAAARAGMVVAIEHVWHTAGWSHQSLAGKPVYEPFSEVLADHREG
jgi:hypothetical protein